MKKYYKHPRFKAIELMSVSDILQQWSITNDNNASGNGGITTSSYEDGPVVGPNNGTAAAKGSSWSFDDDY